jgi:O-antigen ligase
MSRGTVIMMEEMRSSRRRMELHSTIRVALLFSLLLFAVLAFGAVEPWSVCALETGAALLAGYELSRAFAAPGRFRNHALYPALAGMTVVVLLQLAAGTTVYSWITASQLKGLVALELLFFVAVQLLRDQARVRLFFILLSAAGMLVAVFALVQKFTGNGRIYWVKSLQYEFAYFGPYVNKNHYAGLMEMLFPLPLFLAFSLRDLEKRVFLAFMSVLMAASIFLSNSRGGMLACIVQVLLITVLIAASGREDERSHRWVWAAGLLIAVIVIVGWLGGGSAVERLLTLREPMADDTSGNRLTILRDCLPIIRQHFWFGTGLGTFPTIYPSYRSFYSEAFVNAGHNDYLQLIVETGLLGALAFGWFFFVYIRSCVRLLRGWQFSPFATLQIAACVSCLGLLIHSVVDFNLHIPANAALFFVLLAISTLGPQRKESPVDPYKIRSM